MKPQSLHCHLPGTPSNLVIFERMRFSLPSKSHTGLVQGRRLVLTAHVSVYAVPGLAVVVNVAPQPLGELIGVDGATVGLRVEAGKRLQGEADGELGAGEKKDVLTNSFFPVLDYQVTGR